MQTIPVWFIPSFYGDIKVEADSETTCKVITTELTSKEVEAIGSLEVMAVKKAWLPLEGRLSSSGTTLLQAPIAKVSKALAKLLKPGRTVISAVKFTDGTMEEIRSATAPADPGTQAGKGKTPRAATSVAAPVRGCPAPDFSQSEIRAQRVLTTFLSPEQIMDFRKHQKFISVGQVTGNNYMITSRHARDQLAQYTRSLYDLDRRAPICTHDWDVPAAEEMLALHVFLQLPGWESYLIENTEDNMETSLHAHLSSDGLNADPDEDFERQVLFHGGPAAAEPVTGQAPGPTRYVNGRIVDRFGRDVQ